MSTTLASVRADGLRSWLETRGFGQFADVLEAEHVCGGDLSDPHFSLADIEAFGVGTKNEQRALFDAVKGVPSVSAATTGRLKSALAKKGRRGEKSASVSPQAASKAAPRRSASAARAQATVDAARAASPTFLMRVKHILTPETRDSTWSDLKRSAAARRRGVPSQDSAGSIVVRGATGEWDGFSGIYRVCTERYAAGPFGKPSNDLLLPLRGCVWTKPLGPGGVQFWFQGMVQVQVYIYRHANGCWYIASSKAMMMNGEGGHFRSLETNSDTPCALQWQRQHDEDGDGRWDTGAAVWSTDRAISVRPIRVPVSATTQLVSEKTGVGMTMLSLDKVVAREVGAKCPLIKIDLANGNVEVRRSLDFQPNSADPADETLFDEVLAQLATVVVCANSHLPDAADLHFIIAGHADVPPEKALQKWCVALTQTRADAVKRHLMRMGVDAGYLHPRGYGGSQPLPGVLVGEGERPNMRVEFRVTSASEWASQIARPLTYDPNWQR